MNKSELFLMLAFSFLVSCTNPAKPSRNNLGSGNTNTKPSWFLTDEEQKTAQMIHTITLGHTTSDPKQYYRIPAVLLTKKNTIIAAFDNRKTSNDDIGFANSDLIEPTVRRSTNGGKTWSENIRVGEEPTTKINSHGDSVLFETKDGNLVILTASGGAFKWETEQKSRIAVSISKDDGKSWSNWKDVQGDIFTSGTIVNNGFSKGFIASGRGTTLSDGTLAATMLVGSSNYSKKGAVTYYSQDNGETWKVGGFIVYNADDFDEPKIIAQLTDESLLMSARPKTQGKERLWATAKSVTDNWQKVSYASGLIDGRANAEGVRYTLKSKGHSKDRLLFLNCNSSTERTQLTLHMSEDEGVTWKTKKIIQQGRSCYSSIDVLGDGTIITFAEEPSVSSAIDNYDLVFRRFNLYSFTSGNQTYTDTW